MSATDTEHHHGPEPGELTATQREAARQLNYHRAKMRLELDEERRPPPLPVRRDRRWWHGIDWPDLALRELIAAVVTGVIISAAFYGIESRREQRVLETSERLENVRFVRQLSVSSPGSRKPLANIDLSGTNLNGLEITDADLAYADLTNADLAYADLTEANLYGANLTDANLTNADLTEANLYGANLTDANLTRADLTEANLYGANLTRADLTDTNLTDTNLTDPTYTVPDVFFSAGFINSDPPRVGEPESVAS